MSIFRARLGCTLRNAIGFCKRKNNHGTGFGLPESSGASAEELASARIHCLDLLRRYDSPSYTLLAFVPPKAQSAYIAIRAFNLEIARIADTVSTPHVGALRLQFWRDNVTKTFAGAPPKQPVSILLADALEQLKVRTDGRARLSKSWFLRIISARERYLNNNPYPTLEALEQYAEHTYSTLLYLTLQALPMSSVAADHVASHVGKAAGIVAVLRGLPLLAFPPSPNHHSSNAGLGEAVQQQRVRSSEGVVTLPLDVMAEVGLREENVLRQGADAEGLKDAVFKVATRASDHLITAQSMITNLRRGEEVGHAFEHEEEDEHRRERELSSSTDQQLAQVDQAFGVFMPAVSTRIWLDRLQKVDFDIFRAELRGRDWRLPWKAYLAFQRKQLP